MKRNNQQLIDELRRTANFENAGFRLPGSANHMGNDEDTNAIREATRLYRDSWVNPIIDEIERRLVKPKKGN